MGVSLFHFWSKKVGPFGCILLFVASTAVAAVSGDEHWDTRFGWPGPGGNNYAIASHNGRIYVAGLGTTNTPLMLWDGAQWNLMSQFYASASALVTSLAFVGDTLYAAGQFTNVDGVTVNGVARWNGSSWSSIGFKGTAYGLAVDGNDLYVSGAFSTNLSGLVLNEIARWDGAAWHALGSGLGASSNGAVAYSVIVTNGMVYAGGSFTNSGALAVTNVARWDGANWQPLAGGPGAVVNSLAMNGSTLYAAGIFGSSPKSAVSQWDGSSWTLLGSGFDTAGQSLTVFNNQLCVAGSFTTASGVSASRFAVWNGSVWTPAGSGLSSSTLRALSTGSNVLVSGNFLLAGGQVANGLASWDGSAWASIGVPGRMGGVSATVRAAAFDGTNLFAGGSFTAAGQTSASYIARFDGINWYSLGTGIGPVASSTVVNSISVTNGKVYVGGYFSTAGGVSAVNAAMWDGTAWYGLNGGLGGEIYTISAQPDGVYASGTQFTGTQYGGGFLMRWDGSQWNSVLKYNANDTFSQFPLSTSAGMYTFTFLGSDLYVSGAFSITWHDPGLTVFSNSPNIMRFDGTYARIVGSGLGGTNANAMAVFQNNLYVGGPFTTAGGVTASGLASWDGSAWHNAIGGGIVGLGTVNALASDNSYLYVGGTFTNLGGQSIAHIAKWDGANWSALGSGANTTVGALNILGPDLYAGGSFRSAGGKVSEFVGHWNSQSNFNIPSLINPAWLTNGQFQLRQFGVSGVTNIIFASTNLTDWSGIATNTNGVYDFTDTNSPGFQQRFYRAAVSQ